LTLLTLRHTIETGQDYLTPFNYPFQWNDSRGTAGETP